MAYCFTILIAFPNTGTARSTPSNEWSYHKSLLVFNKQTVDTQTCSSALMLSSSQPTSSITSSSRRLRNSSDTDTSTKCWCTKLLAASYRPVHIMVSANCRTPRQFFGCNLGTEQKKRRRLERACELWRVICSKWYRCLCRWKSEHLSWRKVQQASLTFCSCRKLAPIRRAWTFCWSMAMCPLYAKLMRDSSALEGDTMQTADVKGQTPKSTRCV